MATDEARDIYREARKPHTFTQHRATQARACDAWAHAKRHAALLRRWRAAERAGLVALCAVPDYATTFEEVAGDLFAPEHAATVPGGMRTIEAQRKEMLRAFETDGAAGVVGYFRTDPSEDSAPEWADMSEMECDGWQQADSVWGFEATYAEESRDALDDYAGDIARATLDALAAALRARGGRCPTCGTRS